MYTFLFDAPTRTFLFSSSQRKKKEYTKCVWDRECVCVCARARVPIRAYVCASACVRASMSMCACACVYTSMRACTHARACLYNMSVRTHTGRVETNPSPSPSFIVLMPRPSASFSIGSLPRSP